MKLLILGIDGATFDLILPWAEAGHLPNLANLMETGVRSTLNSTLPPVTSPEILASSKTVLAIWCGL